MRARLLPLLIACATVSPAYAAPAADNASRDTSSIQVIGFTSDHFEQAAALTRVIKKTLELSTNFEPGTGDYSLEVLTVALGCPEKPDSACLKKIANKITAQKFLWGSMEFEGKRVEVELHLHAEDASDKKVKFSYQASLTDSMDGDLPSIAANAISQLLGPLRFRVVVRSKEKTGTVLVDGKEAGSLVDGELTVDLPNGEHQFRLMPGTASSAEKHAGEKPNAAATAELTARVSIAESTKVRLDRQPSEMSGARDQSTTPDEANGSSSSAKTSASAKAFDEQAAKSGNAQRTWGYIALAGGGALLAGGAVAATSLYVLNNKSNFQRYRDGLRTDEDACTEADHGREVSGAMTARGVRSLCKQASVLEVLEVALLASGVVAAGTGLTLLLTSKPNTATALHSIEPKVVVGRGRTDIGISVAF